jgi:hypothetical protein
MSQLDELVPGQTQLRPKVREVFIHQPDWKFIAPCWNVRMGGKYCRCTNFISSIFEDFPLQRAHGCVRGP